MMLRRRGLMACGSELPIGYTRCKYLESNGKQLIYTNVLTKSGVSKTVAEIQFTSYYGERQLLGADYGFYFGINKGFYEIGPNNISRLPANIFEFDTVVHESNTYESWQRLSVNGSGFYYRSPYNTWVYGSKYCIFDVLGLTPTYAKIASICYSNNDSVVGNFIPAIDNEGKPCMFDTVTNQPFYNDGTGEFGYELMDGTYVPPV